MPRKLDKSTSFDIPLVHLSSQVPLTGKSAAASCSKKNVAEIWTNDFNNFIVKNWLSFKGVNLNLYISNKNRKKFQAYVIITFKPLNLIISRKVVDCCREFL